MSRFDGLDKRELETLWNAAHNRVFSQRPKHDEPLPPHLEEAGRRFTELSDALVAKGCKSFGAFRRFD